MDILGLGIDIISINRIKKIIRLNKSFKNRIFTKSEKIYCNKKNEFSCYAKKYAAKEAFVKAIGTGFRDEINFINIEIKNDKLGKPFIVLNKTISTKIKKRFNVKNFSIFLSLSDEKEYAIANIIIAK